MPYLQPIYFLLCLLAIDLITLRLLRKLLRDFLRTKKNKQEMRQLHTSQPMRKRILLDYIYPLLKHNHRVFLFYHRLYLSVLFLSLAQYPILAVLYSLIARIALYITLALGIGKLLLYFIIRANFDANMVSIYRKSP